MAEKLNGSLNLGGEAPAQVLASFWLEREHDAERINRFVNDPSIYPFVRGRQTGRLDMTPYFSPNSPHVVFCADYGGVIFEKKLPGLYAMHTAVIPEGRGEIVMAGSKQAFYLMFTQTDCIEILTHCPDGNLAAKAGARASGMRLDWVADGAYPNNGHLVDCDIYSLKITDWILQSPFTESIGVWFHKRLWEIYESLGIDLRQHSSDRNHNRIVGGAVAMIAAGQVYKGVSVYNRWAVMSSHDPVLCVSTSPVKISLGDVTLTIQDGEMSGELCRSE